MFCMDEWIGWTWIGLVLLFSPGKVSKNIKSGVSAGNFDISVEKIACFYSMCMFDFQWSYILIFACFHEGC